MTTDTARFVQTLKMDQLIHKHNRARQLLKELKELMSKTEMKDWEMLIQFFDDYIRDLKLDIAIERNK